jgi:hypothetical protein
MSKLPPFLNNNNNLKDNLEDVLKKPSLGGADLDIMNPNGGTMIMDRSHPTFTERFSDNSHTSSVASSGLLIPPGARFDAIVPGDTSPLRLNRPGFNGPPVYAQSGEPDFDELLPPNSDIGFNRNRPFQNHMGGPSFNQGFGDPFGNRRF